MPLNTRTRSVSVLTATVSRQSEAELWHSSDKLFLLDYSPPYPTSTSPTRIHSAQLLCCRV